MAEKHPNPDALAAAAASTELCAVDRGHPTDEGGFHRASAANRDPRKWGKSGSGVQPRALRSQPPLENAARERSRVQNLRQAFHSLQAALPSVPPDTKLSKLDVLVLATNYIAHLSRTLDQGGRGSQLPASRRAEGYLHPVKKWPMRSLLYCGSVEEMLRAVPTARAEICEEDDARSLTPDPMGQRD
ncbi:transcription factor 24 [Scleropages formosus]|uniref:Transcription factor 24-like n=1 Tax=Scleropages formosus TaxID=113540 RepID=A0A8C9WA49_SCLFO|nr:transcription factor 24-like [Scleropages formosus]